MVILFDPSVQPGGHTWSGEGGRGHPPGQPDQPNQPWQSVGWQMSQPDCPHILTGHLKGGIWGWSLPLCKVFLKDSCIRSFMNSFNKQLLSIFYATSTVLGPEDKTVNKTVLVSRKLPDSAGDGQKHPCNFQMWNKCYSWDKNRIYGLRGSLYQLEWKSEVSKNHLRAWRM